MTVEFRNTLFHLPILCVFLLALFTGIRGIDYGYHWDEDRIFGALSRSIETGVMLPRWYNYPSMTYNVALLGLTPELIRYHNPYRFSPGQFTKRHRLNLENSSSSNNLVSDPSSPFYRYAERELRLRETITDKQFHFRIRILFLFLSLLSVFWVYITVYVQNRNFWEAFLAASLLGLSWEIAYHSRWIAPDTLLMQFGAVALLCSVYSLVHHPSRASAFCLCISAIAAGFACGSKYQGGLLLLVVFSTVYFTSQTASPLRERTFWTRCLLLFLVFCGAYLLSTPGTIVEPYEFVHDVRFEINHYQTGHWGHSVDAGLPHFLRILSYLSFSLLSPYPIIAIFFFLLLIPGVSQLIRQNRRYALLILLFPACYVLYMSMQRVMLVRNLLIIAPFLSILVAAGARFLHEQYLSRKSLAISFHILILLLLTTNAFWLVHSSETIRNRSEIDYPVAVLKYLTDHPQEKFSFSSRVTKELKETDYTIATKPSTKSTENTLVIFYASEAETPGESWPANRWNYYTLLPVGPYEVNYNYYPDWLGDDRIIILPVERARMLGVPFP